MRPPPNTQLPPTKCGSAYPNVTLYLSWPYWLEVRPGARPTPATQLHAAATCQHYYKRLMVEHWQMRSAAVATASRCTHVVPAEQQSLHLSTYALGLVVGQIVP